MLKNAPRHLPDRGVRDARKDGVAHLLHTVRRRARKAVANDERGGHTDDNIGRTHRRGGRCELRRIRRRHRVDEMLEDKRHLDVDELRSDEQRERRHDARLHRSIERLICGPNVVPQRLEDQRRLLSAVHPSIAQATLLSLCAGDGNLGQCH